MPFKLIFTSKEKIEDFRVNIFFYNASGSFSADGSFSSKATGNIIYPGLQKIDFLIESVPLKAGLYRIGLNIFDPNGEIIVWSYKEYSIKVTDSNTGAVSDCQLLVSILDK